MLTVATVLWDANEKSESFSRCYDEEWVERLYRGFARNLTVPFEFVCFTDRPREFGKHYIGQERIRAKTPDYGSCVEPFKLNEPMIFVGLDTVVVGNLDHMADYCMTADKIALPKHPYEDFSINGVVLCPAGQRRIFDEWRGENDMDWMRRWPHERIDALWPGQIVSYKAHVARQGLSDKARIVYMHGRPKMHELPNEPFVKAHWI